MCRVLFVALYGIVKRFMVCAVLLCVIVCADFVVRIAFVVGCCGLCWFGVSCVVLVWFVWCC